jgi:hypothetical protein
MCFKKHFLHKSSKIDPKLYIITHSMDAASNHELSNESIDVGYPRHYQLLQGENQVVHGTRWSTERLLATYVSSTDGIIGRMDGSIPYNESSAIFAHNNITQEEKRDLPPPQAVIYLDKSARPVEWMVRALWDTLASPKVGPDGASSIPNIPKSHFLNIDKGDWLMRMGVPPMHLEDTPVEMIDFEKIDREHLTRIRALYSTVTISEDNLEDAWKHPTIFDGQHVMIVDEVASSGQTLNIALHLLGAAIPAATFSGNYWAIPKRYALRGGAPVDGKMQFAREWVPVWYSADFKTGRGISDKDPRWPVIRKMSPTDPGRIGKDLLSTPPHDLITNELVQDKQANQLRREITYLARDLREGHILYQPAISRPSKSDEDFARLKARIEALNGISFDQWMARRDALLDPKS